MHIAFDLSPLSKGNFLQHRVRGTGFYTENLKNSLQFNFPKNEYTFFTQGEKLSENIDIVHYPYFEPFFLTFPIIKKHKTVITIHDLTPLVFKEHFPSGLKGRVKWELQKYLLQNVDAIITDSNSSKKDILKFINISAQKVYTIYLSAGKEFKKKLISKSNISELQKKYNLPDKFSLYVGDITWNKNLPKLISAIKKTNIPLCLIGRALVDKDFDTKNPWNKDRLIVQKEMENNKQFILLGFVPQDDLVSLYNLATVFVMPSLYEGFGLPVLEAMNCGCPVVTSKEGSIPEVAGQAAFYVDAYNIDSIADGIKEVFENKNLQNELSKSGLNQAKKFSWEKTVTETINVYEKILQS